MTVKMYDSIEVAQIPASAQAVAGYVGGKWPTFPELAGKFPKAQRLSIAVNSSEDAECLDIEAGDASAGDAPKWFRRQTARGVARPCFYTSLSNVGHLLATLEQAGIHRGDYRLWSAHYTGSAHLCGPSEGISTYADATQYWDKALGRNLDVSLCTDSFFGAVDPPNAYIPNDEVNWVREWTHLLGRKTLAAHVRRLFLRRKMIHREREIVAIAYRTGWVLRNRHDRYRRLFACTKST